MTCKHANYFRATDCRASIHAVCFCRKTCKHGTHGVPAWRASMACMACQHGVPAWRASMACQHGVPAWRASMACQHGVPAWRASMACQHGVPAWRLTCIHVIISRSPWGHGWVAPNKRHCKQWSSSLFCGFLPNPFIQDLCLWRTSQEFLKTDSYLLSRGLWSLSGMPSVRPGTGQ